jgi:hypothetical protein
MPTVVDTAIAAYCTECGTHYPLSKGHECPDPRQMLYPPTNTVDTGPKTPSVCETTLRTALELTGGDRAKQHGDKRQNHQNIADLWNAYLGGKAVFGPSAGMSIWRREPFTPHDVAIMMCLLKIARLKSGSHNPDNYIDLAGYAGVAAECADGQ